MKYFPLIWATLWRKKARTILTLLSIVIAFLLFGVLETIDYAFSHPSSGITGADKLVTTNKFSITLPLPISDTATNPFGPGHRGSHAGSVLVRRLLSGTEELRFRAPRRHRQLFQPAQGRIRGERRGRCRLTATPAPVRW